MWFFLQKYEMIKTEDIPHLENSTFSTRVVKDIAQNILSFLKSNCTKEGHTYWLFKGERWLILSLCRMLMWALVCMVSNCFLLTLQRVGATLWSFMILLLCVRRLKKRNVRIPSLFLWQYYSTSKYRYLKIYTAGSRGENWFSHYISGRATVDMYSR